MSPQAFSPSSNVLRRGSGGGKREYRFDARRIDANASLTRALHSTSNFIEILSASTNNTLRQA